VDCFYKLAFGSRKVSQTTPPESFQTELDDGTVVKAMKSLGEPWSVEIDGPEGNLVLNPGAGGISDKVDSLIEALTNLKTHLEE